MLDVTLTVTLKIKGPALSQSTQIGSYGIDAPMARDVDGRYCFPRALIKGRLCQAMRELQAATAGGEFAASFAEQTINDLFGFKSEDHLHPTSPVDPGRGRLHFEDFVNEDGKRNNSLFRIRIDEARGSVEKGQLLTIDAPFASGQEASFTGEINYLARDAHEAQSIRQAVTCGFRWLEHLGAEKSIGFGQILDVEVESNERNLRIAFNPPTTGASGADSLCIVVKPETPFCIARPRKVENLFESERVIPGGVLKGTLAATWRALLGLGGGAVGDEMDGTRPELCRNFARLRFTHAFPAVAGRNARPVTPPLSLVKCQIPTLYDVAMCDRPGLIGSPPVAPGFQIDWKRDDDVQAMFGWCDPPRRLIVRTAIERNRAKDESLFAYEMVIPRNCEWHARIDLHDVPSDERAPVEAQLRSLLKHRLRGLGKTKAFARVEVFDGGAIAPVMKSQPEPVAGRWIVALQTAALLCDPRRLDEASGREELHEAYASVWNQLSGGDENRQGHLKLVRFFAVQSLVGGQYLHKRFRANENYNPYLLTDAGSVFVLEANGDEEEAGKLIRDWIDKGLPLPEWAIEMYAGGAREAWARCPFVPENGYGEIAVNLAAHWNLKPKEEAFHAVS